MFPFRVFKATIFLAVSGIALGATPYLVKDLNPATGSAGSEPLEILAVEDVAYFTAKDSINGYQLRKTDGTPQGTSIVYNSGLVGTALDSPSNLTRVGSTFFFAGGRSSAKELWKSDGSSGGTVLVKDIAPGTGSSFPGRFTPKGNLLYFTANDTVNGTELWRSDGTAAGTWMVKDIRQGSGSSEPRSLTVAGDLLYFLADDGINGIEIWRSDGTSGGTSLLKTIVPPQVSPGLKCLTAFGSQLLFCADDGISGMELWISDGTSEGTRLVKDLSPGVGSGLANVEDGELVVKGDAVYFGGSNGSHGIELWRSDGSAGGTTMVKDLIPGSSGSGARLIATLDSQLVFTASTPGRGNELWSSNGTSEGTVMLPELRPGTEGLEIQDREVAGGILYFSANDGTSGLELWKTDGTVSGTLRVADILQGSGSSDPAKMTAFKDGILFTANDGTRGRELWRSDETAEGTSIVKDVEPAAGSGIGNFADGDWIAVGDIVYFAGFTPEHGNELWRTDGTQEGTRMVADSNPGTGSTGPSYLTRSGDLIFFEGYREAQGYELWRTDGTPEGTFMVKDIFPGASSSSPMYLIDQHGFLFFLANDGVNSAQLWRSDGTPEGTSMVRAIEPGGQNPISLPFASAGDFVFFGARTAANGEELWRSDGTVNGTALIKDISNNFSGQDLLFSAYPASITSAGDFVYFTATNAPTGRELWRSDGTESGTFQLRDIVPGTGNGLGSGSLVRTHGTNLIFSSGSTIWKTDGTSAGTQPVKNITPAAPEFGSSFAVQGGRVFFPTTEPGLMSELWVCDGTSAGTFKVRPQASGGPRNPYKLVSTPERVYFAAFLPDTLECRLWRSDGTAPGTIALPRFDGVEGATIERIIATSKKVFIIASTIEHGKELWALDLKPVITVEQPEGSMLSTLGGQVTWDSTETDGAGKTFRVGNEGESGLQGLQIMLDPPDTGVFQLSTEQTDATLAPGESTTFTVTRVSASEAAFVSLRISSTTADVVPMEVGLVAALPLPELEVDPATVTFDPETGLYRLVAVLTNPWVGSVGPFEVVVRNLPSGVTLQGAEDGRILLYPSQIARGASAQLVLWIEAPGGLGTLAPEFTVQAVPPEVPFGIDGVRRTADGFTLRFPAKAGRRYVVQYSDNGNPWTPCPDPIDARSNRVEWTDLGPPQTHVEPGQVNKRFYRVVKLGAQ